MTEIIIINRLLNENINQVQALFWDIKRWSHLWRPIETVSLNYSDSLHQEFVMKVERNGTIERVRTARFQSHHKIDFISLTPPPMMSYHRGQWVFEQVTPHACIVRAVREYTLKDPKRSAQAIFKHQFANRLGSILDNFDLHTATQSTKGNQK